ncbi:MAG: putative transcriptional regulator [uncultured archaeon A07HN63]|nr:MAG: putative transcriptional regulator [uncultured archaeon A07HN63]
MPVDFKTYDPDDDRSLQLTDGSNAHTILEFLADHPEQGFTPKEISETTDVPRGSVGTTLSRLHDRGLVRHKEPYWAIGDDDRLASYGAMVNGLAAAEDRFGEEEFGDWQETAVDPRTIDSEGDDG